MKILALSDTEAPALWDYFNRSRLEGIDVIVACGDLKAEYLSFLATFFQGPVLYVPGNHDSSYEKRPPEGCISIDGTIYEYEGVRFLGLGGSMRYKPGAFQYTEGQMRLRAMKLWLKLCRGGFDVLVTHAPAKGLGDEADPAHAGFEIFRTLLDKFSPKYHLHGHVHLSYNTASPRICTYKDTTIINAYERYVFEL